ncbi:hypothetical protein ACQKCU_11310 [Heyndrickxia sporothermodurans]
MISILYLLPQPLRLSNSLVKYATEPTSWEIALELASNKVGYKTIIIPSLNEV